VSQPLPPPPPPPSYKCMHTFAICSARKALFARNTIFVEYMSSVLANEGKMNYQTKGGERTNKGVSARHGKGWFVQ